MNNYLEDYYRYRAGLIRQLKESLQEKKYDIRDKWTQLYEDASDKLYDINVQIYLSDYDYTLYNIVYYDGKNFLGYDSSLETSSGLI